MCHRTGGYSRKYEAPYLGRGGRVQKMPTDNVPKYVDCGRHLTFRTRQARPGGCGGRTRVSHRTGGYSRTYEAPYLGRGGRVQKMPTDNMPKYVDCGRHLTCRTRQARPSWCDGRTRVCLRTVGYLRLYEAPYIGRGGLVQKTPTDNVPTYVDFGRHLTSPWPRLIPRLGLPRSAARLASRNCIVRESGSAAASSDPRRLSHRLFLHVFIMPGTLFFRKASVCFFFCPSRRLIALSSSISITSPHGLFVSLRRLLSFLALLVVCACAPALLRPPPIASCFAFYFLFATPRCSAPPTLSLWEPLLFLNSKVLFGLWSGVSFPGLR